MLRRAAEALWADAYVLLTLAAAAWAGNQVVGKYVAGKIPPVSFAAMRWTLATLIILPFAWPHLRRAWPVVRANWLLLVFLGVIGNGVLNTMQYLGLQSTSAMNALVLNSAIPMLIPIIAALVFRDRIGLVAILGILVSMAGVLAVVSRGSLEALLGLTLVKGDVLIFIGMLSWAIYTCLLRLRPAMHMLAFVAVLYGAAALANIPFAAFEVLGTGARIRMDVTTALAVAYVAVFPSVLAGIAFNRGVELIGANRSGVFNHLIPMFGAVMAIAFLGETLGRHHLAGFALILAGVWLAARQPAGNDAKASTL